MKIIKLIISLFLTTGVINAQSTKDLLNLVLSDIVVGDNCIELQRIKKVLCLSFDSTQKYYNSIKDIILNPYFGYWDSTQFDNVIESNNYNILIEKQDSACIKEKKIWHCLLSPISYNQDSTIALIQYYKSILLTDDNESGIILYKIRNDKWTRGPIIEQYSEKKL